MPSRPQERLARARRERQGIAEQKQRLHASYLEAKQEQESTRLRALSSRRASSVGDVEDSDERIKIKLRKIAEDNKERALMQKILQRNLQRAFTNTRNLSMDLFKAFCK